MSHRPMIIVVIVRPHDLDLDLQGQGQPKVKCSKRLRSVRKHVKSARRPCLRVSKQFGSVRLPSPKFTKMLVKTSFFVGI